MIRWQCRSCGGYVIAGTFTQAKHRMKAQCKSYSDHEPEPRTDSREQAKLGAF